MTSMSDAVKEAVECNKLSACLTITLDGTALNRRLWGMNGVVKVVMVSEGVPAGGCLQQMGMTAGINMIIACQDINP